MTPVSTSPMPPLAMPGLPRTQRSARHRRGDQRAGSLEHDDRRIVRAGSTAPRRSACTAAGVATEQARSFARVRRQNPVAARWRGSRGQQVERVGVDDQRQAAVQAAPTSVSPRRPWPSPGPTAMTRRPREQRREVGRRRRQPCAHEFGARGRRSRELSGCVATAHQTGAGAQRGLRREPDGTGHARTATDDQHVPDDSPCATLRARRGNARSAGPQPARRATGIIPSKHACRHAEVVDEHASPA